MCRFASRTVGIGSRAMKDSRNVRHRRKKPLEWGSALPQEAVEHFMGGGCDVFAVALHQEYGFQPVAVRGYYRTRDGKIRYETPHVAAMTPSGDVVDASGIMSPADILSVNWYFEHKVFDVRLVPISVHEAATTFGPALSAERVKDAREMARMLLE